MLKKSGPRTPREDATSPQHVDEVNLQTREAQPRVMQPWVDLSDGDYMSHQLLSHSVCSTCGRWW
jgi:hypothetical protein